MADAPKILGTDTLRTAYPKLNSAIDNANVALTTAGTAKSTADTAKTTADTALSNSEYTQTQLDTIVINGDSSVEAAQARVKSDGTTFTTLQQRLNDSDAQLAENANRLKAFEINVKIPFGTGLTPAKGDGVTDDAAAIQAIIDYAIANKLTVKIPAGTYLISASLKLNGNNIRLVGAGRDVTYIKTIGAINAIEKTTTALTQHILIDGISIVGNNTGQHGIKILNQSRLQIRNVIIADFVNGLTEWAWVSELEHIYIGNTTNGFRILGGTSTTFKQCYSNTSKNGFILGDLDNEFGYGQLVLQYSTFIDCASDHADEWAYKILAAQGVNFINCGSEYSGIGAYFIGDGKNSTGVQVAYSNIVMDSPFALLNDNDLVLPTQCFIRNQGRNNLVEIRGLADGAVRGTFTKFIDDIVNSSSPVVIKNSNYKFNQTASTGGFTFEKGHLWGARSESRQSLPILSNTSKMMNATNLAHKTAGNEFELFVFAPNDGDMVTGYIEAYPLKWSDTTVPNPVRVPFFAQNVAGTIKAKVNLPNDVVTSATVQATSAGMTVFRLWLRFSATTLTTDPYMIFAEVYSDQTTNTQRTIIIK